jgi:hypothetical protein
MRLHFRQCKTQTDWEECLKVFTGKQGATYKLFINKNIMHYKIINANRHTIVASSVKDGVRVPKIYRTLRNQFIKALRRLGVVVQIETRIKK